MRDVFFWGELAGEGTGLRVLRIDMVDNSEITTHNSPYSTGEKRRCIPQRRSDEKQCRGEVSVQELDARKAPHPHLKQRRPPPQ